MKSSITTSTLAGLVGISLLSQATAQVNIDWVRVENLNNAADTADGDRFTSGVQTFGAVSYGYSIGKYEVTNAQYTVFLNAVDASGTNPNGIWNASMGSDARGGISFNAGGASGAKYSVKTGMGNKPVNYVSWYDAARFTNWLHNGQGSGSTETGSYTLNNATSGIFIRNAWATYVLPSDNEWYKAAYYDPTPGAGGGDNYWLYPNKSNTITTADANYGNSVGTVTDVGNYSSDPSFYGTFDMGGNVSEWSEAVLDDGARRGLRGASFANLSAIDLSSSTLFREPPSEEQSYIGFRVAAVPEPSGLVLTMLIGAGFVCHRRRSL